MKFLKKYYQKLINIFKQGLTPKQLGLSITLSILISLFPIYGVTTLIITAIALRFKLNLPLMIIVSYAAEPLKLFTLIPFIKIGGKIFNVEHTLLSLEAIKESFHNNTVFQTIESISFELLCGFMGWAIIAIPLSIPFYFILKGVLSFFMSNKRNELTIETK